MGLTQKLQEISELIADPRFDKKKRKEISQELRDLHRRSEVYRSEDEYIAYIERNLARAHAIREGDSEPSDDAITDVTDWDGIEDVADVDWRQKPLCGCSSPTCDILRGELPSACRDRTNGLLDQRSAPTRVKTYLQKHTRPHALRVVHRGWATGYGEVRAEATELVGKARELYPEDQPGAAWSSD